MRSLWAKIGLTSDQSSYRILQDQDDKRIPIATGVWTATVYNASIKVKRCSDKKFKRNLASMILHQFVSRFMGIFFPGFWSIRVLQQKYNWILKRWQVPPIEAHFRILWSWLLHPRKELDPNPLTVILIPIPRLEIPDPGSVIPDPIYLVTTLLWAHQESCQEIMSAGSNAYFGSPRGF